MWTFSTPELCVYKYAETRSGDVAKQMLEDSTGTIVVDQFTGYNQVTKPGGRTRAGCMAHTRRKIFESSEHKDFDVALSAISSLYEVEREAKEAGIVGTEAHQKSQASSAGPLELSLCRHERLRRTARSALLADRER
jgi:transposase